MTAFIFLMQVFFVFFSIEGKKMILIDDVLFTGRTIRAVWMHHLIFIFKKNLSMCFINRLCRHLSIQVLNPSILFSQKIKMHWKIKDEVAILNA